MFLIYLIQWLRLKDFFFFISQSQPLSAIAHGALDLNP